VRYFGWSALNQAAYLEMTTFLSPYVLASQGDRTAMAHGVEERTPFLDHRLFEFAAALPTGSRLRGLKGKEILRRWASRILPAHVTGRIGPTRRVTHTANFFGPRAPEWVREHLSADAIRRAGVFSPGSVDNLLKRWHDGLTPGSPGSNALTAVLTTQLWHQQFVERMTLPAPLSVHGAAVMLTETSFAYTERLQ
jgi:asparagine synthase (glutamine-hydrolysing)